MRTIVYRILGSSVLVLTAGLLTACSTTNYPSPASSVSTASGADQLEDPLESVKDPNSSDFVGLDIVPLLHAQGAGNAEYTINKPAGPIAVRFYVACSPESEFTVRMGTFFSGQCAPKFQNSGQFPTDVDAENRSVNLEIPDSVKYWILALPIQ